VFATLHLRSASSPPHLCVLSELCVKIPPSFDSHGYTSRKTSTKPGQRNSFQINALRTLSFSVSRKSLVCRSYENCRGVYQQFPFWNSTTYGHQPHSLFPTTYPLSFHILAHSFALFCLHAKPNSFLFMQFRTLSQKHPGVGYPLRPSFRQESLSVSTRTYGKDRDLCQKIAFKGQTRPDYFTSCSTPPLAVGRIPCSRVKASSTGAATIARTRSRNAGTSSFVSPLVSMGSCR